MFESLRNLGKAVLSPQGIIIITIITIALLTVVDVFMLNDLNRFARDLFLVGLAVSVWLFRGWIRHDAQAELKSLQIQKQELKQTQGKSAPPPDVSTKEPWLFP